MKTSCFPQRQGVHFRSGAPGKPSHSVNNDNLLRAGTTRGRYTSKVNPARQLVCRDGYDVFLPRLCRLVVQYLDTLA